MPRMLRFAHPGSLVHIIARGIDGQKVFIDNKDREEFLKRLAHGLQKVEYRCLAWCLLSNHYHLFLRTNEIPMSGLMRPLNGGYAQWFNRKYGRRGYLFQDRFKSVLCQDQEYAKQLVRYIHLNPLRAGEAKSLEELKTWPWCGHGFLIGFRGSIGHVFQDRQEALRRFGQTPEVAVSGYLSFLLAGIDDQRPEISGRLNSSEPRIPSSTFSRERTLEKSCRSWPSGPPSRPSASRMKACTPATFAPSCS